VGHSKSIKFLHLTKEERDELAGKIKIGVTFDRILDDIRESVAVAPNEIETASSNNYIHHPPLQFTTSINTTKKFF